MSEVKKACEDCKERPVSDDHFIEVDGDKGLRYQCSKTGNFSQILQCLCEFDVLVDTREPWEAVAGHLSNTDAKFRVDTLHYKADFLVNAGCFGTLGIQRKRVNDFVGSIDTLKEDLHELREHHDLSALLIEGNYRLAGDSIGLRRGNEVVQSMSAKGWHDFLISQQLRGTHFAYTTELRETCKVLSWWAEYLSEPLSPPSDDSGHPITVLLYIPGIGPGNAVNIFEHFGSVYEALTNIEDWDDVHGIGPATRDSVIEWLEGET